MRILFLFPILLSKILLKKENENSLIQLAFVQHFNKQPMPLPLHHASNLIKS